MNKNCFTVLLLITAMISSVFCVTALAAAPSEVYTGYQGGSNHHAGNGTAASPYNLFEDALNAVADGGTIYITESSAFLNDIDGISPLVIRKNITISAAPGLNFRPEFNIRTPGIVLGANVTFKNIVLSFANGYRPIVCANGYALTMDHTSYSGSTRVIHLAGGGMYRYASVEAGPQSSIIVRGKDALFGNIYAGSINGSFDKDVKIMLDGVPGSNIGVIYACGAKEGYYNGNNFLDPGNEPDFPKADAYSYPVSGSVSIELNDTGIREIYGETGGGRNAAVSVSACVLASCSLINIRALEVKEGTFMPDIMNDGADVSVHAGAVLDISNLSDCEVNHFSGGGILIMDYDDCLIINGECTGETEFRTKGGSQNHSYIALPEHLYIKTTEGNGTFTFHPYHTQQGMTFEKNSSGWMTGAEPERPKTVLTKFHLNDELVFAGASDMNQGIDIPVTAEFTQETFYNDIGMIPFEYTVRCNGETYRASSAALEEYEGYYEGNIPALNLNFSPIGDTICISSFSSAFGNFGEIAPGVYDIDITAPTETGNVLCSLRLAVIEDGEKPDEWIVTDTDGGIYATYTNVTGGDIDGAVLFAGAYRNGVMKKIDISSITVKQNESQSVRFDMSDVNYDTIKIFIWNSIEGMVPVCKEYLSQ